MFTSYSKGGQPEVYLFMIKRIAGSVLSMMGYEPVNFPNFKSPSPNTKLAIQTRAIP